MNWLARHKEWAPGVGSNGAEWEPEEESNELAGTAIGVVAKSLVEGNGVEAGTRVEGNGWLYNGCGCQGWGRTEASGSQDRSRTNWLALHREWAPGVKSDGAEWQPG